MAEDSKAKPKLVENEEKILAFWNKNETFKKSLEKDSPRGEFVFYDGPPFANGEPHYGHILASVIKDVIPRYKTMSGFHVPRRWGWDCHGLPVENLIEKELGLKSRKDIENYGINKFNTEAEKSVLRYADVWRKSIPRFGRWVDMENDYRTMDAGYTEAVWWVFKSIHEKGLIYEGFKPMQLCPRCGTTLSNFEVNQGYKDITDISVYIKFEIIGEPNTFFLAWTTTPWTLPGNVVLAVGNKIQYVKVKSENQFFILAKERLADSFGNRQHEIVEEMMGDKLVGKEYKPLFPYYDNDKLAHRKNGFKVYDADFVTTTDGTGIVHIAPAFGEDDMNLGKKYGLPFIQHVGIDGRFKKEVVDFHGQEVKPIDDHQKADVEMIKYLAHKGLLFEKKKIIHSYPHCWRCQTPLLNYASSSWFVNVSSFKDKLVKANQAVSWVPSDIRDGRFGKWLEGARDWAISRSRYWGAPLPVWKNDDGEVLVLGSIEDIKKHTKARNKYFMMRHGEADNNILEVISSNPKTQHHLTVKGKGQVESSAQKLKSKNIDLIITSPILRTKETAEIVRNILNLPKGSVVVDDRIIELQAGDLDGKKMNNRKDFFNSKEEFFHKKFPNGESRMDIYARMSDALHHIEKSYVGKTILIITHGTPSWLLKAGAEGRNFDALYNANSEKDVYLGNAEFTDIDYKPLPRDEKGEVNFHRPYIDTVKLYSNSGKEMYRVPEVFDCWFESGAMPYGEACYKGVSTKEFDPRGGLFKKAKGFPADFIAEGLDQTRGWFYSMIVLGVALFGKSPYKNVVVNGILLAENGEKMSKSLKNYPDPMLVINKYGMDALRYYLLSSPAVSAQDLCFSEKGVDESAKKLLQRLDNVLSFYELYATDNSESKNNSKNILDKWIVSRLNELVSVVTSSMELYQLDKASRPLMDFVDDLSTWYLRRSRDRFKSNDLEDKESALGTIRNVLNELSKIMAPFTPFYAEYLYSKTIYKGDVESVHLADWPKFVEKTDQNLLKEMLLVRKICSLGLEARMKAKINVRQPLESVKIKLTEVRLGNELLNLIKDELNVKSVEYSVIENDVELNTVISSELKEEGDMRELVRAIQELRKTEGLTVGDKVVLVVDTDLNGKKIIEKYKSEIMRITLVKEVKLEQILLGNEIKIGESSFKLEFKK